MAQGLTEALSDLANVTINRSAHYGNADYRVLYIDPAERLRNSLLSNREILVVIAPFSDIQNRAIRFVGDQLQAAQGRLEPGMAVVVHEDIAGNDNLREWGREQGITILPVLTYPHMPMGEDLENILRTGLYSHDPFDLTGPVRSAHQFFGRSDLPDLVRRFRSGHIQALFGMRKIGKTSVLNRILQEAKDHHDIACAMVDCSDDDISSLSGGRLLNSISGAVNDALNFSASHYANLIPLSEDVSCPEAGRVLLSTLSGAKQPVLLLFDEIDYISPSSPVAAHWKHDFNVFFRALRQVYQECSRQEIPFSILICGVSSRWFSVEDIAGVENSALALVPESYLPPFDRNQSVDMLQTLGRAAGVIFHSKAADLVAATCSDNPFWMRKAGSYINSCYPNEKRPVKFNSPEAVTLAQEFIEIQGSQLAGSSLRHLFRIYPELGPVAVACMRGDDVSDVPQEIISTLGQYGILGADLSLSGPMVEAGLRQWDAERLNKPEPLPFESSEPTRGRSAIESGSNSAAGEEEWAELLSEVGRLRNILERHLREFIIAIVRAECAKDSSQRKPPDILLAAVSSERKESFASANTGTILKKLTWLELISVIKRNWPWFEPYFGDRKQVELQSDIINDRPDAHAKDFDGADLALQRRSISWFEQRISASDIL